MIMKIPEGSICYRSVDDPKECFISRGALLEPFLYSRNGKLFFEIDPKRFWGSYESRLGREDYFSRYRSNKPALYGYVLLWRDKSFRRAEECPKEVEVAPSFGSFRVDYLGQTEKGTIICLCLETSPFVKDMPTVACKLFAGSSGRMQRVQIFDISTPHSDGVHFTTEIGEIVKPYDGRSAVTINGEAMRKLDREAFQIVADTETIQMNLKGEE